MNSKHTIGPWKKIGQIITGPPLKREVPGGQVPPVDANAVAYVRSDESGDYRHYPAEQAEEHARLIAAAPEVLDTLRFAVNLAEDRAIWDEGNVPSNAEAEFIVKARALITKATGE